jgi:hypothetical protein
MRNSFEDRFTKLGCSTETREERSPKAPRIAGLRRLSLEQPSAAKHLVSATEVRQQNGEHAGARVSIDSASMSGFELGVRVNDHELSIRPREDEGCTVAMRICADTVHGKVAIDLPAQCFTVERDLDAVLEECDCTVEPGMGFAVASQAQVSDGDGNEVCARLLHQPASPGGFVLEVILAGGCIVIVSLCADDCKFVAIRFCTDGFDRAYRLLKVTMPKHVMTAPARTTP